MLSACLVHVTTTTNNSNNHNSANHLQPPMTTTHTQVVDCIPSVYTHYLETRKPLVITQCLHAQYVIY